MVFLAAYKTNYGGFTALMIASEHGYAEAVAKLLEKGANLEKTNYEGFTALMIASLHGHDKVVAKLLEKGADPQQATCRNQILNNEIS